MIRSAARRYRDFLRLPDVAKLLAIALVTRLPIGTLSLSMLLHVRARTDSFAIAGVLLELAFPVGPMLVGLALAVATPAAAFAMAWCFCVLAVPLFFASPALKYWRHEPHAERHLLGPLTEPRLFFVYGATFLFTFALGLLEIGYPGFATSIGLPPFAGVLLAINSAGSAVGGLAYGALH